jgi:hypothetical protein
MSKQPVHVIRYGLIKVTIWRNATQRNGVRHTVAPIRLFKDGDTWRESTLFGRDDLPLLAKAIDQAHTWIYTEARAEEPSSDAKTTTRV